MVCFHCDGQIPPNLILGHKHLPISGITTRCILPSPPVEYPAACFPPSHLVDDPARSVLFWWHDLVLVPPSIFCVSTSCLSPWQLYHNCNYRDRVNCLVHVTHSQRSINSSISRPEEPPWFCYVARSTGSLSGSVALKCKKLSVCPWLLWGGSLSFGFSSFFFLFLKKNKCCFAQSWEVGDFKDLGTTVSKKSYYHSGLAPMRPNELWTYPDDGAARAQASDC